jgi:hypothetical protein
MIHEICQLIWHSILFIKIFDACFTELRRNK